MTKIWPYPAGFSPRHAASSRKDSRLEEDRTERWVRRLRPAPFLLTLRLRASTLSLGWLIAQIERMT